ncbi:hypothetical protein CYMTET_14650 [Cymbomonas tetramitiformis]|uniref:Uncharacterized protein n=1 Tax=Cymbomonas tetramitiformis TaxID=36881 RepID=A0AAE0GH41_9CHLO|nr:hypothetical protein CYMTET_14650 [Cymbomonas tetramitiformis]
MPLVRSDDALNAATRTAVASIRDECGYSYVCDWVNVESDVCKRAHVRAPFMHVSCAAWCNLRRAAATCNRECYFVNDANQNECAIVLCAHRVGVPSPPTSTNATSRSVEQVDVDPLQEPKHDRDRALSQSLEYVWRDRVKHAATLLSMAKGRYWDDEMIARLTKLCTNMASKTSVHRVIDNVSGKLRSVIITEARFVPFATLDALMHEATRMVCESRGVIVDVDVHTATITVDIVDQKRKLEQSAVEASSCKRRR